MNCSISAFNSNTTWLEVGNLEITMVCMNFFLAFPAHSYVLWLIITRNVIALEFLNFSFSLCEIGTYMDSLIYTISCLSSRLITLSQFLQGLTITGRPLFQCLICVERFLAVVHPVTFLKYKPLRYRLICCAVAWMIVLVSCLCCLLILMLSPGYAHAWFFSLQFLLFVSIQLFCLMAVLRALKQSGPGEKKREKEENHMKRRAFFIILISTANMVIVYFPYTLIELINILRQQNVPALWFTALICYLLASFSQFFLYLHRAGKLSCFCSP